MLNTAPLTWVVSHFYGILAWAGFISVIVFALYRFLVLCYHGARLATTIEQRVLDGEKTLHLVATNHLPHLQIELENINKNVTGLRDDIKLVLLAKKE